VYFLDTEVFLADRDLADWSNSFGPEVKPANTSTDIESRCELAWAPWEMRDFLFLDQYWVQLEADEVPDPHDLGVDLVLGCHEAGVMADGHQANADLWKIWVESVLGRNLIHLKSRKLERLFGNFIHASISALSLNIDVKLARRVIFGKRKFAVGTAAMVEGKKLFPWELVVETKLLVEEASSDILLVTRNRDGANA
jgi:hypothetical protein